MSLDSKWLELLKVTGWKAFALALTCGLFLLAARLEMIPPLADWMKQAAVFVLILCGSLAVVSAFSSVFEIFAVRTRFVQWGRRAQERQAVRKYLPHVTPKEREIFAYLLAHKQKTLTGDSDGGYANTLISRRFLVPSLQPGQVFSVTEMPFIVPDHIWEVLEQNKTAFPYTPQIDDEGETGVEGEPWRVHWMAR